MTADPPDGDGPKDESELSEGYDYVFPDELLGDDRERGLSKNDRRFLVTGETRTGEPSERVGANTRSRIRKRIRETIVDFWLAMRYLDKHDRDLIFEERELLENVELSHGIKNTIQFFYRGLEDSDLTDFETSLASAVHDAEQDRHDGPVLVETEFDVDVDEQFHVQEAYDKFRKGTPLEPMEVGALLVSGRVTDADEVQRLARHARGHGLIESSVSPLLADHISDLLGEPPPERVYSTRAHLSDHEAQVEDEMDGPVIEMKDVLDWEPPDPDTRPATRDDLTNPDVNDDVGAFKAEDAEDDEDSADAGR